MAVRTITSKPQELLDGVIAAIRSGKIITWQLDNDGDITHATEQWKYKAWFRPAVEQGALVFRILGRNDVAMSREVYAIYHGRLVEMLLAHFDLKFSAVSATALPGAGENVGKKEERSLG